MLQTILNSRMRTPDGTILESKHRHDYVTHLDANGKEYFLDGGLDYVHCSANGDEYLLTIYPDYPHELIRLHVKWGTYGKEGDQPLKYVAIADLDPYHLRAILDTQQKTMRPEMYKVMQDEVDYRNAPPEMDDREVVIDVDQANIAMGWTPPKNDSGTVMKVKIYQLIERIVEEGTQAGYDRAHKHTDTPSEETIKQCIEQYIMNGFDEYFEFENEDML